MNYKILSLHCYSSNLVHFDWVESSLRIVIYRVPHQHFT